MGRAESEARSGLQTKEWDLSPWGVGRGHFCVPYLPVQSGFSLSNTYSLLYIMLELEEHLFLLSFVLFNIPHVSVTRQHLSFSVQLISCSTMPSSFLHAVADGGASVLLTSHCGCVNIYTHVYMDMDMCVYVYTCIPPFLHPFISRLMLKLFPCLS